MYIYGQNFDDNRILQAALLVDRSFKIKEIIESFYQGNTDRRGILLKLIF
jgi:hypothetical protein